MSSKTAPMKGQMSCNLQTTSAWQHSIATLPRARSKDVKVPGLAQPGAPFVLGSPRISTWSPTLMRPSWDSAAR
eukprot:7158965-Pyramimonas_sp.AAC.1